MNDSLKAKLEQAKAYLGAKWILHPINQKGKLPPEKRAKH